MKKVLLMFALGAMVLGAKAQALKVSNDGKVFLGKVETINGWRYSYLQFGSHSLVLGTTVGDYAHNSIDLKPGGATQGWLHSQLRMYTATGPNQQTLQVCINSNGSTYFNNPGNFGIGTNNPTSKFHLLSGGVDLTFRFNTGIVPEIGTLNGIIYFRNSNGVFNTTAAMAYGIASDSNLKENILPLEHSTTILKKLKTYSYNFKSTSLEKNEMRKKDYGVLAQELEAVLPDLVLTVEGDKFVNYDGFIPILINGFNEQQVLIEKQQVVIKDLQQEMETLRATLTACCNSKIQKSMQEFDLTGSEEVSTEELKVYQNTPNPFNETTIISCYIPENIKKAELCIYDMTGSRLKCLTVTERGTTNIQIQAGQLAAGVYTYLLIGDGKASEAKQMILTK